ncbi:MAG: aminopeptidase [Phycisphaerales bacterium]|nr:aminopeptidase [Phycisphaerales bacterium]
MNAIRRRALTMIIASGLVLLSGCEGLEYVTHVAQGQIDVNTSTESIEAVLASGRLTDDEADKLRMIGRARAYAVEIGLNAGSSYTTYYDAGDNPLAFNLSASRRDKLDPVTWTFPIVGELPYLAFFDEGYLRDEEQKLIDDGFDTYTYEIDAYSTLGVFEDPIRSPMLRRNRLSLADTIVHEVLHNTIYRPNNTNFNESLATFVGRTGAVEFLTREYGEDSGWATFAEQRYADTDAINAFLVDFVAELRVYYAQAKPPGELVSGREAVFEAGRRRFVDEVQPTLNFPDSYGFYAELPTNNAWVLLNVRYNLDLDVFQRVFERVDGDWAAALGVFREAAAAAGDPFEYLRNWPDE